jgi:hypothetical protein
LEFNAEAPASPDSSDGGFDVDGEDDAMGEDRLPVLTKEVLRGWQKSILEVGFLLSQNLLPL